MIQVRMPLIRLRDSLHHKLRDMLGRVPLRVRL